MTVLLSEQADALRDLQDICRQLAVDVVLIGAIAYRIWMPDENRLTEDVDAVVALDLDELPRLTDRLAVLRWRQDERSQQRDRPHWVQQQLNHPCRFLDLAK